MKFKLGGSKTLSVKVTTSESELQFDMSKNATGEDLFAQVVRTLGIRETWYFGIQYTDKDGTAAWLRLDKKIVSHDLPSATLYEFFFKVKFFPEDVAEELIQPITIQHFYRQVKNDIISGRIYCPTETAVLLASYACVAKFDKCPTSLPIDKLIPGREQYEFTDEQWFERIITYYKDHQDITREDAMLQYLTLAQDLEMYGVETFNIKNKKGTELVLGVDALGLSIFNPDNLLEPKIGFPWSEIRNLSYRDRKFIIEPADKTAPKFYFMVSRTKTTKSILALCQGNHDLYMRRRKADSIEVQQMKIQAKEERELKEQERQRLREARLQRMEYEEKLQQLKSEMRQKENEFAEMTLKVSDFQKKINELEMLLQEERQQRSSLEQNQLILAKMNEQLKEESAASAEERRALLEQRDRVQREVDEQKTTLAAKEAEKERTEKELERLRQEKEAVAAMKHSNGRGDSTPTETGSTDGENERVEFEVVEGLRRPEDTRTTEVSRNEDLQSKLTQLKSDLNRARDETKMRPADRHHEFNVREGRDKYQTLRNIRAGNTMSRVEQFESM